jgi:hypothetical protein
MGDGITGLALAYPKRLGGLVNCRAHVATRETDSAGLSPVMATKTRSSPFDWK